MYTVIYIERLRAGLGAALDRLPAQTTAHKDTREDRVRELLLLLLLAAGSLS
jgi:hypothetical protein